MIRPSKHSHPDLTIVSVAYVILKHLKKRRTETYSDLLSVIEHHRESSRALFLPAVNLLFLLGLIRYIPKSDRFEYTAKQ